MSQNLQLVEPPLSSTQPEDVSFEQWLTRFGMRVKTSWWAVIITTVTNSLYPLISKFVTSDPALILQWILSATCGFQVIVIFVLIVWWTLIRTRTFLPDDTSDEAKAREDKVREECEYTDPAKWAEAKRDAQTALTHYQHYWTGLLVFWLMLYALLTFMFMPGMTDNYVLTISVNFVNNCASLAFLFCYFTLNEPEALSSQGQQNGKAKHWGLWLAVLILITVLEAICTILAAKGMLGAGIKAKGVAEFFGYIGGAGAAAAMGLYLSRLGSKFLACPFWLKDLLYIYMAIQPMFAKLIVQNTEGAIILANAALLLKGLLCLYSIFLFEHGRLLFYFVRVRRLGEIVNSQMRNFSLTLK
jgi:hypothetical protein